MSVSSLSVQEGEFLVQALAGIKIKLVRFLHGFACSEVVPLTLEMNRCREVVMNAVNSPRTYRVFAVLHIILIGLMRSFSKIWPSVVKSIAIPMVDFVLGFFSRHPFPDDAMGKDFSFADSTAHIGHVAFHDDDMAKWLPGPRGIRGLPCSVASELCARPHSPRQYPCLIRIIIKGFTKIACFWHDDRSHFVLLRRTMVRDAVWPPQVTGVSFLHAKVP